MIIGIDLGTTNSLAACMTPDGPRLIPNALGEVLTPSIVGIDPDGCLLVGQSAKELQVTQPDRCASSFKRHMGTDWAKKIADKTWTPEQLSAFVLQALKEDAEAHLAQPVTRAVITVPAYFNELQRRATISAGKMAGFQVERIINEPTAAAIAYGFHEANAERILVIFDLGGGTFDVSVVETFHGVVEVRASSGDTFLGGQDFTSAMVARLLAASGRVLEVAELESPRLVARLMQQCELAKCRLSSSPEATLRIPDQNGEFSAESDGTVVTREHLRAWTDHTLNRIDLPLRRALSDAGLKPADVDEVLLVGGATRMLAVGERLAARFGKEPQQRFNPDEVVALGAAVQAALIARDQAVDDFVVTDIAPFTLGTDIAKELGGTRRPGYFAPIIHRNTPIPTSRVEHFGTTRPNQTAVDIGVYQGEHRRVEKNVLLGRVMLEGIPEGPPGQGIAIRFTYDLNGVLEVEATILETGKKVTHVFTQHAHGMTEDEIAQAVEAMQELKLHPREATRNRFLLRRAERVYVELPLKEQSQLSRLLDGFEEAVEFNDAELIEKYAEELEYFLDRFDTKLNGTDDGDNNEQASF